jgi:hypothetical protein
MREDGHTLIVFHSLSDQAPTGVRRVESQYLFFQFYFNLCFCFVFVWLVVPTFLANGNNKRAKEENEFPLFSGRANSARRKDRLRGSHRSDVGRATKGEGRLHNYKLQMELEIRDLLGYHKRAVYALLLLFAFLYAYVPTPALLARSLNDTS